MIAVCTACHQMYETTTEDAYSPDRMCADCYKQQKASVPDLRSETLGYIRDAQDYNTQAQRIAELERLNSVYQAELQAARTAAELMRQELAAKDQYISALADALEA